MTLPAQTEKIIHELAVVLFNHGGDFLAPIALIQFAQESFQSLPIQPLRQSSARNETIRARNARFIRLLAGTSAGRVCGHMSLCQLIPQSSVSAKIPLLLVEPGVP